VRKDTLYLLVLLIVVGCGGPPPPAVYNDHLFDAIQTAIANKDVYWLDQYANRARACQKSGQLTIEQYRGVEAIIKKANVGEWTAADRELEEFRRQQPSVKAPK
jgi:hypothetical protein